MTRIIKNPADIGKGLLETRIDILERRIEYLSEALRSIANYAGTKDMKNLARFAQSKLARIKNQ